MGGREASPTPAWAQTTPPAPGQTFCLPITKPVPPPHTPGPLPPHGSRSCGGLLFLFFSFFLFLVLLFRAAPATYGSSQVGVKLELQLLIYPTVTALWDLSHVCDLHHSSRQHQILNSLSEARDWTCILMYTNQVPHTLCDPSIPAVQSSCRDQLLYPSLSAFVACVKLALSFSIRIRTNVF